MPVATARPLAQNTARMIPALKKAITLVLLCTALLSAFNADARVQYYRYSGNLPFVDMMLNMMAAMGIIERVPAYAMNGGNYGGRYGAMSSLLSPQGWPYNGYSPYSNYSSSPYSTYGGWPGTGYRSGVPLTVNPLLGFPGGSPVYSSWINPYDSGYGPYKASPFDRNLYRGLNHDRYGYYDDDCYDGYCGGGYSRRRNLDGLWVAGNGELLGLRDQRFLWSDGNTEYTTGIIERTPRLIRAYIDDSDRQIVYRYKLIGHEMLTIDATGTLRIFRRVPVNQASAYMKGRSGPSLDGYSTDTGIGLMPEPVPEPEIYRDLLYEHTGSGGVTGQADDTDSFLN